MIVRVTDLCGREAPYETDTSDMEPALADILYELSLDNEAPWFIGEYQYDELPA